MHAVQVAAAELDRGALERIRVEEPGLPEQAAIRSALAEPHIVQERIELPTEPYPALTPEGVVLADRIVDTAPFVFNGSHLDGCLTRISTASLVNVTAGGGSTVPTFVVEPRPT